MGRCCVIAADSLTEDGKVFSFGTNLINMGVAETPFLLFNNPVGSGKIISLLRIVIGANGNQSSGSIFRFYFNPTITVNGTTLSIVNNRVGSSLTSIATAFSQPTASSNGTFAFPRVFPNAFGSVEIDLSWKPILQAGVSALVTVAAAANNTPVHISFVWSEK